MDMTTSINELPDEILELILGYLPPYKDLDECMLVSKRWNYIAKSVLRRKQMNLLNGITESRLCWYMNNPSEVFGPSPISGRFSHAAAIHNNSMYVFGGCSSSETVFNDLWRFDLSKRYWVRISSSGTYPAPKASPLMITYRNTILLHGGWRYASNYPLYQDWLVFNELHVYDLITNTWTDITTFKQDVQQLLPPPFLTGHTATIHGTKLIIFGGYWGEKLYDSIRNISNAIWCLNLERYEWHIVNIKMGKRPAGRYGHIQIKINDDNFLIMGGCGGPNNILHDAWILNMSDEHEWEWIQVNVINKQWAATHIWCNPGCKVGTKVVILGPTQSVPSDFQMMKNVWPTSVRRPAQRPHFLRRRSYDDILIQPELRDNLLNNVRINPPRIQQPRNEHIQRQQIIENRQEQQPGRSQQQQQQQQQHQNIQDNNQENCNNLPPAASKISEIRNNSQQQSTSSISAVVASTANINKNDVKNRLQKNLQLRFRTESDNHFLPKRFNETMHEHSNGRLAMAAFNDPQTMKEQRMESIRRMQLKFEILQQRLLKIKEQQNDMNDKVASSTQSTPTSSPSPSSSLSSSSSSSSSTLSTQQLKPLESTTNATASTSTQKLDINQQLPTSPQPQTPPPSPSPSPSSLPSASPSPSPSPSSSSLSSSLKKEPVQQHSPSVSNSPQKPSPQPLQQQPQHNLQQQQLQLLPPPQQQPQPPIQQQQQQQRSIHHYNKDDIPTKRAKNNCLGIYVCDLSEILNESDPTLKWIEYKNDNVITGAPEKVVLSTIVAGNGELLIFGGKTHSLSQKLQRHQASNTLYTLTVPMDIN